MADNNHFVIAKRQAEARLVQQTERELALGSSRAGVARRGACGPQISLR